MTELIEKLEADLTAVKFTRQRIDILNALAWELRDLDTKRGLALAETAYRLAQDEQYSKGIADSLIAQCQFIFTNYVQALSQGMQALAIYEELEDLPGQARALYTLSWAHWSFDNFIEAAELGQQAHTLAQQTGDLALEADTLNNLGLVHKRSGNFEPGYASYNKALELYRTVGDRVRQYKVLTNIALANAAQGRYEDALASAHEALQLGIDSTLFTGYTYLVLGQAYLGSKNFEKAHTYLQRALSFAREQEIEQLLLATMEAIGKLHVERQQPDLAIAHLHEALALATDIRSKLYVFRCHEMLSQVYEKQGDLELALTHYKEFHAVKEDLFNDKNTHRLQALEVQHKAEIARREAEIYQLRNIELEREIIEHRQLEESLQQQATTDVLTGVSNRRHFLDLAAYEMKRTLRLGQPLSLALIDLDHFKQINDRFGHSSGDLALIAFANIIRKNIRDIDIFARYGGDEFVLLLPHTGPDQAVAIVERFRHTLGTQRISLVGTLVAITISTGITAFAGEQDSLDGLLKRADRALYRAKEMGRNHISIEPAAG